MAGASDTTRLWAEGCRNLRDRGRPARAAIRLISGDTGREASLVFVLPVARGALTLGRVRSPRLQFLLACWAVAAGARAVPLLDERVELLFRPLQGEMAALSPDGQRLAYTLTRGSELSLVLMNLEPPGPRRIVKVGPEGTSAAEEGTMPTRLRFLRWATGGRLVYAPVERIVPLPPVADANGRPMPNPDGPTIISPIFVVDVDGKERGTLVDARDFQETPDSARRTLADLLRTPQQLAAINKAPVGWRMPHLEVVGFNQRDRDQMVLLTHGGHSMPRTHLVDLRTGDVREFGAEWPVPPGEPQVFDWYRLKPVGEHTGDARQTTLWRDDELARVQRELEVKFPHRVVELLDWNETRTRMLARVTGGSDAGRIFVWHKPEDIVDEVLQCAPWLGTKLNPTRFFECAASDGAKLSGYVTWPTAPAGTPPPLLVMFPSGFPGHGQPAFDPEAQVFADLGFAVVRLNHRCVAGVFAKDLPALRAGVDRVTVQDARTVIDWLATRQPARPVDRTRVVAFGRGFGGYLAVRARQIEPSVFQAGIALDAPLELRAWLQGMPSEGGGDIPPAVAAQPGVDWKKLSALAAADAPTTPVFLLVEPGRNAAVDAATSEWRARGAALGRPGDFLALDPGFAAARPAARASVYRAMGDFLQRSVRGFVMEGAKEGP